MSVGCAMRTMNQQLATSFRCARRTLHWFIELIRASLGFFDEEENRVEPVGRNPFAPKVLPMSSE